MFFLNYANPIYIPSVVGWPKNRLSIALYAYDNKDENVIISLSFLFIDAIIITCTRNHNR